MLHALSLLLVGQHMVFKRDVSIAMLESEAGYEEVVCVDFGTDFQRVIRDHASLLPFVELRTAEAALEFVRTGTTAYTGGLFMIDQSLLLELISEDELPSTFLGMSQSLGHYVVPNHKMAIVGRSRWHADGHPAALVQKTSQGFIVERVVMCWRMSDLRLHHRFAREKKMIRETIDIKNSTFTRQVLWTKPVTNLWAFESMRDLRWRR